MNDVVVKVFAVNPAAVLPRAATQQAACYDVHACLTAHTRIETINEYGEHRERPVTEGMFTVFAGERALIPTGCIFDIPQGWSMRLHPRSGIAWKNGVSLVNCEGVIDSDYVDQTMIALINHTEINFVIKHGDRIAQMELIPVCKAAFELIDQPPKSKSDRTGGFGSTGVET